MSVPEIVNDPISKAIVSSGNFAYLKIPAAELRGFFDSSFPALAKNHLADCASGYLHRFTAGHDIVIDIPKTLINHGPLEASKQLGHILITDFPTKQGIPIPGFSESGLGQWLTEVVGIPKPYLCINAMDVAVGVFACTEGTLDIINICANNVRMSPEVFLDTFVEGSVELAGGCAIKNPLLVAAGFENLAAGVYSSCYTITHPIWYTTFWDVAGGGLAGGMTSLLISKFILKKDNATCLANVTKSVSISSLFAVSTGFGIAGIIGMAASGYGRFLISKDNAKRAIFYRITKERYFDFLECVSHCSPDLAKWIIEFEKDKSFIPELPEYQIEFNDMPLIEYQFGEDLQMMHRI